MTAPESDGFDDAVLERLSEKVKGNRLRRMRSRVLEFNGRVA